MPTNPEVQRLFDQIERMKRELAEAEGMLQSVKKQMQEEFGVNTSDGAEKKLKALTVEADAAEQYAHDKLDEVKVLLAQVGC